MFQVAGLQGGIRIQDLRGLEAELTRLSVCCHGGVIEQCRIIESLSNRS